MGWKSTGWLWVRGKQKSRFLITFSKLCTELLILIGWENEHVWIPYAAGFCGFILKLMFNTKSQKVISNCGAGIRYLHCCAQIFEKNNLKNGRLIWVCGFRGCSWWSANTIVSRLMAKCSSEKKSPWPRKLLCGS